MPQGLQRPKEQDCRPPRVELSYGDKEVFPANKYFPDARAATATKRAVEQIVKDIWKQVGGLSQSILAQGVKRITVMLSDGDSHDVLWDFGPTTLFITPYDGSIVWRREVRNLLGAAFALTFYWVPVSRLAGKAMAGEWPEESQRGPKTRWAEAFNRGDAWDDEDWGFTEQLVTALLESWGFPPSQAWQGILHEALFRRIPGEPHL